LTERFNPRDYASFDYVSYSLSDDGATFVGSYALSGPVERIEFAETITLPTGRPTEQSHVLARLLFLACGLSYYKTACPAVIRVTGGMTDAEHHFLSTLIENGLGEFAYRNNLPDSLRPSIKADRLPVRPVDDSGWSIDRDPLVPIGGGKDSVVTLESVKRIGMRPVAFSVNRFAPIDACVATSGCPSVHAKRVLDPKIGAVNRAGAHNGHVPVTAINSLIGMLTADLLGLGPVVMSNEGSAEYGNLDWNGINVNHQWSKSLVAEKLMRGVVQAGGLAPDRYFSLLRPLSELAIARRFGALPAYFDVFTSCNRLFTLDVDARRTTWCGECPKCHFVFLILAPFLAPDRLTGIFGGNLLDDQANLGAYREILGVDGHKPFECVGDYDEAVLALTMAAEHSAWATSLVRQLIDEVDGAGLLPVPDDRARLFGVGGDHVIPASYIGALHAID
jgi:hypothetical protein